MIMIIAKYTGNLLCRDSYYLHPAVLILNISVSCIHSIFTLEVGYHTTLLNLLLLGFSINPVMMTDDLLATIMSMITICKLYHDISFLLVILCQHLLMSGDVELNPGPLDQGRLLL